MDRLTARNSQGIVFIPKCFEECDGLGSSDKCDHCSVQEEIFNKLAEYEDMSEKVRNAEE